MQNTGTHFYSYTFSLTLSFPSSLVQSIVLPIQRMVDIVESLASNPLSKLDVPDVEASHPLVEIEMLEATFLKLGGLLQVGFGEAGAEIISESVCGDVLDPMVPGKKVKAIFGFSDIRNFADTTRALEEKVMIFVNQIAQIVHSNCHRNQGKPNKNIGEAFLLVWKPKKRESSATLLDVTDKGEVTERTSAVDWEYLAEDAVHAYVSISEELATSTDLKRWERNKQLRMINPSYKVNLGFGFHVGWAIEGAIGSEHKIDASYLSPNVNLASRLDAATKQYGTNVLMSGDFVSLLRPGVQSLCRQVDRVTVKGSNKPMDLYTLDLVIPTRKEDFRKEEKCKEQFPTCHSMTFSLRNVATNKGAKAFTFNTKDRFEGSPDLCSPVHSISHSRSPQSHSRQISRNVSQNQPRHTVDLPACVEERESMDLLDRIEAMQASLPHGFIETFNEGVSLYIAGRWLRAKAKLQSCLHMKSDDKPCAVLLDFMAKTSFVAPESWEGYRALTSK